MRQQGLNSKNQSLRDQIRQVDFYVFYKKRHLLSQCWIKNQVDCGNCGGNHLTKFCRKLDRIVPLQPLLDNYIQQLFDNCRRIRQPPTDNNLKPSNLYKDYEKNG